MSSISVLTPVNPNLLEGGDFVAFRRRRSFRRGRAGRRGRSFKGRRRRRGRALRIGGRM